MGICTFANGSQITYYSNIKYEVVNIVMYTVLQSQRATLSMESFGLPSHDSLELSILTWAKSCPSITATLCISDHVTIDTCTHNKL